MRLATIRGDGTPHVVPVWYLYENGAFYVGTHTRTAKAKNVGETGRAAFCIDVGVHSPDIFGVSGHGKASLLRDDVAAIASKILSRYYDTVDDPAAQELLADTDCIIRIIPDRMASWSY
ncbi:MAG: pyridoxamine 5'-phosphate oxidase family protein [Nitrosopumilaceae archaeon]|nr:pyridoxamine 5'-phosphate oxidase family protein [Nitrosopumilaceae archaeon]